MEIASAASVLAKTTLVKLAKRVSDLSTALESPYITLLLLPSDLHNAHFLVLSPTGAILGHFGSFIIYSKQLLHNKRIILRRRYDSAETRRNSLTASGDRDCSIYQCHHLLSAIFFLVRFGSMAKVQHRGSP